MKQMDPLADQLDLAGIGIGPFNLSLAALLDKCPGVRSRFFERKAQFDWHPELMFDDSTMQTSYIKDLVTPVDPTSPYSFLNHICKRGLFYQFINTQRTTVSRREFELYCSWVTEQLSHRLTFNQEARAVSFENGQFRLDFDHGTITARNICVATGLRPKVPDFAEQFLGPTVFHAKSQRLREMDLRGRSVLIVGGGQTGIEVFRNALKGKWGDARSIQLITRRRGLEPLDESSFTNDFFTPRYVDSFWKLSPEAKERTVASQKLASDGNTPAYLHDLYNDLYQAKHVAQDSRDIRILACRKLVGMSARDGGHCLTVENTLHGRIDEISADIVILSTGFENAVPQVLESLFSRIRFDEQRRFQFRKAYSIEWDGPNENRIYALNFSRHSHGIIDPQTSLMAWRSAVVINDLTGQEIYPVAPQHPNFVEYE